MGPHLYKRGFDDDTEVLKARLAETSLLLEVLAQVNTLSTKRKSFSDFCLNVQKILKEKLKFKYIHIWLRDDKDPHLLQLVTHEDKEISRTATLNKGIIGKAIRERRTICLPDVYSDSDYFCVHPDVKSELCIPLIAEDSIIGAINIETDHYQTFENHISIISMISQHLSNYLQVALLQKTEESYRHLVENMQEGICVCDSEERTLYTNRALQNMTGFTKKELKGKHSYDYFDESSKEIVKKEVEKRKQGISSQYEATLIAKNNEQIPVIIQAVPYINKGTMATLTDMRAVKNAETKLLKTEQFLASITQYCNEAITGLNENGIIQSWNVGAERMFGYKMEEVIGKSIEIIIPQDHIKSGELQQLLKDTRKRGFMRNFETTRLHQNGKPINVYITISAIKDKKGRINGFSVLYRDITPQKKWERELQDRFEKMQDAYKEIGKQRRYLDYLIDLINMAGKGTYSIKQIATFVVNAIVMITKVDATTLRVLDKTINKLVLKAQSGVGEEWWNKKATPYEGSLVEKAVLNGQPLKILDILNEPKYDSPTLARKNNLRSALVIPLEAQGELIGSLTLYLSNENSLSLLDDEFIAIFTKQAALALKLAKDNF